MLKIGPRVVGLLGPNGAAFIPTFAPAVGMALVGRAEVAIADVSGGTQKCGGRGRRLYLPGRTGCLLGRGTERQLPLARTGG
jgi:ABC-type lipopolysaccharide export system ATPase subunit